MAIEKFTWNNGTESNPVPLTTTMMNKLIAAGNNKNIETSVKGYYKETNDRSVVRSIVWSLQQLFPDLQFKGETANDRFSISTAFTQLNEGEYVKIVASGINVNYLKFACVFESITIDPNSVALIDESTIKSRFRFQDGNLIVDAPQENATWSAVFRIKACPVYEDIATTENYRLTGQNADGELESEQAGLIVCDAVAMEGVQISAPEEMSINSLIYINKSPIPSNSTKLAQTTYSYAVSPNTAGSFSGDYFRASTFTGIAQITATPQLFADSLPVSNIIKVNVYESKATTIRIDQNISDPATMVLNPEDCGAKNTENTSNVIAWIRANSHCYVGKFQNESEGMRIKKLYDGDRNYYDADGEQGELAPIDGTPDENGVIADVFLRLPEFYYKTVNETNDAGEDTGVVAISLATGKLDDGYLRWDPNTLIGVYEGTIINDGQFDKLYSISGSTPTNNYSQANFKTAARRRNDMTSVTQSNRFSLVTYQAHVVMALLYYCYWGGETMNCQALLGSGTSTYPKITGGTNGRAMNDTVANYDGNIGSINFWGLENWWGDLTEWVDDLQTANAEGLVNVLSYNGGVDRQVQSGVVMSDWATLCVTKYIFGEHADMIPEAVQEGTSNWNLNFCDGGYVRAASGYGAYRGFIGSDASGGVGCLNLDSAPSYSNARIGSRLLYNGKVTEVTDF